MEDILFFLIFVGLILCLFTEVPELVFKAFIVWTNRNSGHDPKCPTCQKQIKAICRACGWEAE